MKGIFQRTRALGTVSLGTVSLGTVSLCAVSLSALLFLSGCSFLSSSSSSKKVAKFSEYVPQSRARISQDISLSEEKLKSAINRSRSLPPVRFVPIFRKASDRGYGGIPEHRIFQVHPDSAFSLIGFKPGDILLAVHDYTIVSPDKLTFYPEGLLADRSGTITVERAGKLIELNIRVTS